MKRQQAKQQGKDKSKRAKAAGRQRKASMSKSSKATLLYQNMHQTSE